MNRENESQTEELVMNYDNKSLKEELLWISRELQCAWLLLCI